MEKKKLQLVPNKPRKPTGKVVTVQPNDVLIKSKTGFKIVKVKRDKHKKE